VTLYAFDAMTALLQGLRILDLTQSVAGPYATKVLADYGADVIKIERPGRGDVARQRGPFYHDEPGIERSALFLHLNTCKRSVTLDLQTATGREILLDLARNADAVIESYRPGTMAKLGLGYDALAAVNPRLVLTSISNFGQDGPYRDFTAAEIIEYGLGGAMFANGIPGREPTKMGANVVQSQAGQAAALATAVAFFEAEATGEGDWLDVSIMETQLQSQDRRTTQLISYQFCGRVSSRNRRPGYLGGGMRPCADGYVAIMSQNQWFNVVMEMVGHPELAQDPRFATEEARQRPEAPDELEPHILPWYLDRSMRDVWREAQAHKILSGPVYTPGDLVQDPYFRRRGYWETLDHPVTGSIEYPGRPFRVHTERALPRTPAPLLGEHNEAVLCGELGYSARDLQCLRAAGCV